EQGTIIQISELHKSVAESFGEEAFIKKVWQEIAVAHSLSMEKGLSITMNGIPLENDPLSLLSSNDIQPANVSLVYDSFGDKPVKVNLYAGVSDRSKEGGGWYVFCNGRMVLRADQSNTTIWD